MKTSELTGAALDWAVAKCEEQSVRWDTDEDALIYFDREEGGDRNYKPSTDWTQGGPIIERECIDVMFEGPEWYAYMRWASGRTIQYDGPTPLIAAMRCYVASKLGDEVEIPDDLH